MKHKQRSLRKTLITLPFFLQLSVLFIFLLLLMSYALHVGSGGSYTDETFAPIVARSIERLDTGELKIKNTSELDELVDSTPNLWFVVEDINGEHVEFGNVPPEYFSLIGNLSKLSYAQLRGRDSPYQLSAIIRGEKSKVGDLTVMGHGQTYKVTFTVLLASSAVFLPLLIAFTLVSLVLTPFLVRKSLSGINIIANQAQQIDVKQRGSRLSETNVPKEILPLVHAVNDALQRYDEGYESQKRFIASAAHELRTPIAVLRARLDASDEHSCRQYIRDVDRLANIAEQLLDIQRSELEDSRQTISLEELATDVVSNLAPLMIDHKCTMELATFASCKIFCDRGAIERVITNLVHNAVEHGGKNVIIRIIENGFEIDDDGPGIPEIERERVFEAFHRLKPRNTGSGLGLNLVKQIIEGHNGFIAIYTSSRSGTLFRVQFYKPTLLR